MRPSTRTYRFFAGASGFLLLLLATGSFVRADVVFDNLTIQPSFGVTNGTSIGASLITGNSALRISDIILPQFGTANAYVPGETFSIRTRNTDGTVGISLYTAFTLTNDAASGQTTIIPSSPVLLTPNTGYWLVITASVSTAWNFTTGTAYSSLYGVTQPEDNAAYKTIDNGVTSTYFSLAAGPQLYRVDATAVVVPEPSSICLLAVAAVGALGLLGRRGGRRDGIA